MILHLKNGVFFTGENDYLRAFKNIMEPVLNLSYWTEDLEVKDVVFFIENENGRVLSFLIKKYHEEVYVKEHNLDELFDEITESDVDYGGVLVDTTDKKRPKVLPLTQLAFCDQTDMLGGPIAFKMNLSPVKLKQMEKQGWFKQENSASGSAEELIALANFNKDPEGAVKGAKQNTTPGKNIEVYVIHGSLPKRYLDDSEDETLESQLQIVAMYTGKNNKKMGFTIYRKREDEGSIKFFTSQKVSGRALGRGDGERMLHPQIWTNFLEIHKMQMLEAGAKVPLATDDETFTNRNQIQDMENLEITTLKEGRRIFQVPTAATANIQLYQNAISQWFEFAQYAGAAFDPLMGKEQASGTTFRGQERVVQQGRGPHDRRRGKRAKFIEEIYRDAILPEIKREILKGKKFLTTLTADEMKWVTERLADNYASRQITEDILNLQIPRAREVLKEEFRENFQKTGNQRILEILKDEFRDVEVKIGINIAGKQKDLAVLTDKILSIFNVIFANPVAFQQAMQIPGMQKAFYDILEYSNISATDFMSFTQSLSTQTQPQMQSEPSMMQLPAEPIAA